MTDSTQKRLFIQEVSVRDGFQMEPEFIPTDDKIRLINQISRTGVSKIEVTSFTSPKAIPTLADAEEVMKSIDRVDGVEYAALVPNVRGCERALSCGTDEINAVMSASESHNQANLRMGRTDSLQQIRAISELVGTQAVVNVSLSTAFGCPFDGDVPATEIIRLVDQLASLGVKRLTLCDTTGMANPVQVAALFRQVGATFPGLVLTAHFHNTRGMGLANAVAAWQTGVVHFDSSLGGLGGCPYAPGASGNVCTEDMVHMFNAMGLATGVSLEALLDCARALQTLVHRDLPGQVLKAGPSTRRYARKGATCQA